MQYYGGTNYGRTSSSFVTTRYYDEAPLDEYGNYIIARLNLSLYIP